MAFAASDVFDVVTRSGGALHGTKLLATLCNKLGEERPHARHEHAMRAVLYDLAAHGRVVLEFDAADAITRVALPSRPKTDPEKDQLREEIAQLHKQIVELQTHIQRDATTVASAQELIGIAETLRCQAEAEVRQLRDQLARSRQGHPKARLLRRVATLEARVGRLNAECLTRFAVVAELQRKLLAADKYKSYYRAFVDLFKLVDKMRTRVAYLPCGCRVFGCVRINPDCTHGNQEHDVQIDGRSVQLIPEHLAGALELDPAIVEAVRQEVMPNQ